MSRVSWSSSFVLCVWMYHTSTIWDWSNSQCERSGLLLQDQCDRESEVWRPGSPFADNARSRTLQLVAGGRSGAMALWDKWAHQTALSVAQSHMLHSNYHWHHAHTHTHTHTASGRDGGPQRQPQVKHTTCLHLIDVRLTRTNGPQGFITFLTVVLCASLSCCMLFAVASAWNVFGKSVPSEKQEHMTRNTCIKSLVQFMNWPQLTGSWIEIWLLLERNV